MHLSRFCGRGDESTSAFSIIEPLESRRLLAAANVLGTADPSFDHDGQAFALFNDIAGASSVGVQSDGKVLIAGWENSGDNDPDQFAIARFNPDGSPDTTFGGGAGLVTLDPLGFLSGSSDLSDSEATAVGVNASGQILVAGQSVGKVAGSADPANDRIFAVVVRLEKNGDVDTTYGDGGVAWTDFEDTGNSHLNAMIVTNNGSAIVAGGSNGGAVVAKFDPTGQLDTAFNLNGFDRFNVIGEDDADLTSLALAKDGSIYAAGNAGPDDGGIIHEDESDIAIAKLNSAGHLVDGFGADDNGRFAIDGGTVLGQDESGDDRGDAIFLDSHGRVVVVGSVSTNFKTDTGGQMSFQVETAVLRFDSTGQPDGTWGTDGLLPVATALNQSLVNIGAAAAYGSTRYLIAGDTTTGPRVDAINSATGKVDATFGVGGVVSVKRRTTATAIAITDDSSIFLATGQVFGGLVGLPPQQLAGVIKLRALPGTVSGSVYNDVSGDGALQKGEAPVAGEQVYLDFDSNGQPGSNEPIVTTDKHGGFTFSGVGPGSYELRMVLPKGSRVSSPSAGYRRVSVVSNKTTASQNLLFTSHALITGTVFNDGNSDGVQEIVDGDIGLPNLDILIDLNDNGKADKGEVKVLTDAKGNFVIPSLAAGMYHLRVLIPKGGVATSSVEQTIKVKSGQVAKPLKFGVLLP